MSAPIRIQRQRTKGWSMPENTVYVGRGSKWGNPFPHRHWQGLVRTFPGRPGVIEYESRISADGMQHDIFLPDQSGELVRESCNVRYATHAELVELFRRTLQEPDRGMLMGYPSKRGRYTDCTVDEIRAELRGKNLACWCPPGVPCHADVLLELANREAA